MTSRSVCTGSDNDSCMHFSRKTSIYLALAVVVAGAALYYTMGHTDEIPTISVESNAPTSEAQATFLNLAAQIEPVSFDGRVLEDPHFTALQDIHTVIVPETPGRTDPFAPLGGAVKR